MKKSKFTLVIVLGLVLCLLCGTTTTFSWFNRPGVQKGESLSWSGEYNVTNGKNITAVTYAASEADGSVYDTAPFDFSSLQNVSVHAHETKYFCTEVKNTGTASQSISLFLNNSDTNTLSVGVNSPLRTYRRFTSDSQTSYVSRTQYNVNKKNVYVGFVYNKSYDPSQYGIWYWNNNGISGGAGVINKKLGESNYTTANTSHKGYTEKYDVYAAQIDYNADSMYLYYQNKDTKFDGGENHDIGNKNTVIWYEYDSSYHSSYVVSGTAAGISSFYSEAEAVVGNTLDLKATAQGTVTYASSKTDVATVDSNGQVTAQKAGKTTVTVTSTGVYGDKITAECELTVSEEPAKSSYIPIVTNMKIEGKADDDAVVTKVYWYIKNDTASDAEYSLGDLQISL